MSDAKDDVPTPAEPEVPDSDPDTLPQSRRSWRQRAPSNRPARSKQRTESRERDARGREVPGTADKTEAHRKRLSGEDTLLSAPAPSDAGEFHEERLADAERRLDDAEARLRALERVAQGRRAGASPNWLAWVVFLLALAIVWLIWHAA